MPHFPLAKTFEQHALDTLINEKHEFNRCAMALIGLKGWCEIHLSAAWQN